MTSDADEPDWPLLIAVAKVIPRLCHSINRIVYMWGSPVKGPVTKITPTHLRPQVLDQLRTADAIVGLELFENKLTTSIAQVPVVSVPVDPDFSGEGPHSGDRCIAIRTFLTQDFMTGVPAVPGEHVSSDAG